MSSAPNASDPVSVESTTNAPAAEPQARPDISDDAGYVIAAVIRIEDAIREERAKLGRLRAGLGEMAQAIAQTKAAMAESADTPDSAAERKPIDTTALLDEFEHLVDAMIEIAGGQTDGRTGDAGSAATPAAATESDQVPTVSGVVWGLDPERDTAATEPAQPADTADSGAPTVAMLKALVEALNASVPEAHAESEAVAEPEPLAAFEPWTATPAENEAVVAAMTATDEESAPRYREIIATPDAAAASADVATSEHEPAPQPEPEPEREISPEAGTAIAIAETVRSFEMHAAEAAKAPPPPEPAAADPQPEANLPSEPAAAEPAPPPIEMAQAFVALQELPALDMPAVLPGGVALHETDLLARFEEMGARPFPPLEIGTAVIFPPRTEPVHVIVAQPEPTGAPQPAAEPEPRAKIAGAELDAILDPENFLFGPASEPDPAAFLLDAAPDPVALLEAVLQPAPATALPQPEFVAPSPPEPESEQPAPQASPDAPYDPLAPLKAMSDAEKIALFS